MRNTIYYNLKPFIPRWWRTMTRRRIAMRRQNQVRDIWPIMPGSERPPKAWPGWPDGKKFAVVLTHDVEGQRGLDHVKQLAELEMELGFRSSFNFIPEGSYQVPEQLRAWLVSNGCEVGVHDLYHDGLLYQSRAKFAQKATRINRYMKEWGAVGFRSGFMLNELDWLHDLDVQYDASTFDTDPFEPQPDGVGTIFPFWVPRTSNSQPLRAPEPGEGGSTTNESRGGYAELPYTLPQDSTLFLMLGRKNVDLWKTKIDWIAEHGGMAMVNVHPDYIRFAGAGDPDHTYPVDFYRELLHSVRERYGDVVWYALPRDVASFVARHKPEIERQPRRVCMVAYSHYKTDARITRYAEALAEQGDQVDVLALRQSPDDPDQEIAGRVNLVSLQLRVGKQERSPLTFLVSALRFLFAATLWIAKRHALRPYDIFHIHNMPDFLVFAAWYPRLTGAKVILDIHDIVPEFYGSKFGEGKSSKIVALLKWAERVCAGRADKVIISNHLWVEKYAARTGANGKCSVFINNVDTRIFARQPRTRDDGKLIILFPGGLQWHQGLDIALRAFWKVSQKIPQAEFQIYGDGIMKPSLIALTGELGLNGNVRFFDPLPVKEIARVMANADLGVVPKRADSFGNEAYSTKIMEFMSLGVPVVVSNTKIDRYYFDDSVVRFFESGDSDSLAEAIIDVLRDPEMRQKLAARASEYVARNSWEVYKADYLQLVESLCAGR